MFVTGRHMLVSPYLKQLFQLGSLEVDLLSLPLFLCGTMLSQDLEAAANQDAKKTEGRANQIGDDAV
jgi:hypothetical protein